jgi:hypothetical protein
VFDCEIRVKRIIFRFKADYPWKLIVSEMEIFENVNHNDHTSFLKSNHPSLLVVVTSRLHSLSRRLAIRHTISRWIKTDPRVHLLFALGDGSDLSAQMEAEAFGDILLLELRDTYDNLTNKTFSILRWAESVINYIEFLMKIDDDSFVQFDRLLMMLLSLKSKYLYVGHIFTNSRVIKDKNFKYFELDYEGQYYPPYASGSGYVLSSSLITKINNYEAPVRLRNEDVSVGASINSLNVSVKMHHSSLFFPEGSLKCVVDAYLLHRQSIQSFYTYFSNLRQNGVICS